MEIHDSCCHFISITQSDVKVHLCPLDMSMKNEMLKLIQNYKTSTPLLSGDTVTRENPNQLSSGAVYKAWNYSPVRPRSQRGCRS